MICNNFKWSGGFHPANCRPLSAPQFTIQLEKSIIRFLPWHDKTMKKDAHRSWDSGMEMSTNSLFAFICGINSIVGSHSLNQFLTSLAELQGFCSLCCGRAIITTSPPLMIIYHWWKAINISTAATLPNSAQLWSDSCSGLLSWRKTSHYERQRHAVPHGVVAFISISIGLALQRQPSSHSLTDCFNYSCIITNIKRLLLHADSFWGSKCAVCLTYIHWKCCTSYCFNKRKLRRRAVFSIEVIWEHMRNVLYSALDCEFVLFLDGWP